jgi:hypothetical protein
MVRIVTGGGKNKRADSPIAGPQTPVGTVSTVAVDRGFSEKSQGKRPIRVNAHGKRPVMTSPKAQLSSVTSRPLRIRKRARIASEEEEREGTVIHMEGGDVRIIDEIPFPDAPSSSTGRRRDLVPGEEERYYTSEETGGPYCTCDQAEDPTSVYGLLIQCSRRDLCSGSQFYHPECLHDSLEVLPNETENTENLKRFFDEISFVCPSCQEDHLDESFKEGEYTSAEHPNVPDGLHLAMYNHTQRRWRSSYILLTDDTISRRTAYRVTAQDIRNNLLPSLWKDHMVYPPHVYTRVQGVFQQAAFAGTSPAARWMRRWENSLVENNSVYLVIDDLPTRHMQCAKEDRQAHGIGRTDAEEDPIALLRQAAFPRIEHSNYLILTGTDLQHLEIVVAGFGPEDGGEGYGLPTEEAEIWSNFCLSWLATGDLLTLKPIGWRAEDGTEKKKGGPRFRTNRGHPSAGTRAIIHAGVWNPSTIGRSANPGKFPQPTQESMHLTYRRGWQEYLELAQHSTLYKRLGVAHEWIDPVGHLRRMKIIDSLPSYCQRNIPYGSPGTMCVVNFNVTADCHVNPRDLGFTLQVVHGRFQGGDLAFRNLGLRAPTPSGSITMVRTQRIEHTVLDWGPRTGETWNETYRFSHPVTMPRDMVGSSLCNKELWDRYRGGSWAATSGGIVRRDKANVSFDPAAETTLLSTAANLRGILYVGHAHVQEGEERADHMRQPIERILGDYQRPADTIGPEGRIQQQDNAGRAYRDIQSNPALTVDTALQAILREFPSTIPRATPPAPEPLVPRDLMPTPAEMIRFQQVLPLPTADDNRSIMDWWYEVRIRHAEARQEAREHPQRQFRGPTAEHPTISAIGSEISLTTTPVVDLTGIEETRTNVVLRSVRSQAQFTNRAEWVFKYDMSAFVLEILPLDVALDVVRTTRRAAVPVAMAWLRSLATTERIVLIERMPDNWDPTRPTPRVFPGDPEELVNWVSRTWAATPNARQANRIYILPIQPTDLHPAILHLARPVGLASFTRWDYWTRAGTLRGAGAT